MSALKSTLSRNELIRTINVMRTQLAEWRQATVQITGDLLLVDPTNELFTGDFLHQSTIMQVISFAAERLDYLKEKKFKQRVITHLYRTPEMSMEDKTLLTTIDFDLLVQTFRPFRELQVKIMTLDKNEFGKPEISAILDQLDEEMYKLFKHFTGKEFEKNEKKKS